MPESMKVFKYEQAGSLSSAPEDDPLSVHLREMAGRVAESMHRALNATPEQRAQWAAESAEREAEARRMRAEERAARDPVPPTLDALLDRMGWSREYAEHLVQPYCDCGEDIDGWSYCEHARDLGLAP